MGTGAGATLWVGEAGILTALALVVAAVIFSRGHWTIRRVPEVQQVEVAATRASDKRGEDHRQPRPSE